MLSFIDMFGGATLQGSDVGDDRQETRREQAAEGDDTAQSMSNSRPHHRAGAVSDETMRQPKPQG
ncbi:hypothetical protein [Chloroflexus sp.]|uniref:hypothetical protein n=1 Tax=Chloroflexus sp. TaxID=1904827 RepID=UPI002ACED982|nr:hypothetical protein [Chloroflexus sp.]